MKIALLGYGKMGKTIAHLAEEKGHHIVLKINSENSHELTVENLQNADVAIEFSTPTTVIHNIKLCLDASIPIIIGTTAWHSKKAEIESYCHQKNGSMISATNFSIGVNLFFELNKKLADLMSNFPEYKVQITEIHHTQKLDAPSGTAITLAEGLIENNSNYSTWENTKTDNKTILPIESIRTENVPGTHVIKYQSLNDSIAIEHVADNRNGFASGAILAAEWIINKKGIFSMSDVLGF